MADVEIRKRTRNSKSFEDALRAINRAGGPLSLTGPSIALSKSAIRLRGAVR
jgi:hypothetical protein